MKLSPIRRQPCAPAGPSSPMSFAAGTPVVLEQAALRWPATRTWSFDALRHLYGPMEITVRGSDDALAVFFGDVAYRQMRFSDYLDAILPERKPDERRPYLGNFLLNHPEMDEQILALTRDFHFPSLFPGEDDVQYRVWIAGQGQRSTIHNDNYENLNAQIVGRKRFLLFPPAHHSRLYPQKINDNLWSSPVDPQNPSSDAHPLFADIEGYECILDPGDILYIPRYWWHQATSVTSCINLNCWSYSSLTTMPTWELDRDSYATLQG